MNTTTYLTTHSNVLVPQMIYGTAWKKEHSARLVEMALLEGFVGIDTACQPKHYNEFGVGEGLQKALSKGIQRESLFIQTKFTPLRGQDPQNIPYDPKDAISKQVRTSCQVSLQNLGISVIDSLILHSPYPHFEQTMEAWITLESLVKTGVVRQIGISNCYDLSLFEKIFDTASIPPSILQNRFYKDTNFDISLRAFCKKHNVVYQSFWTLTANPTALRAQPIIDCASKYNKTPEQIFFRYLTQRNIAPLNGTTSPQHMREDLAIFEFEITDEDCFQIDTIGPF